VCTRTTTRANGPVTRTSAAGYRVGETGLFWDLNCHKLSDNRSYSPEDDATKKKIKKSFREFLCMLTIKDKEEAGEEVGWGFVESAIDYQWGFDTKLQIKSYLFMLPTTKCVVKRVRESYRTASLRRSTPTRMKSFRPFLDKIISSVCIEVLYR